MNRNAAAVIGFAPGQVGRLCAAFVSWWVQEMRELVHDVLSRIAPRRSITADIALAAGTGAITLSHGRKVSSVVPFERSDQALPIELQTFWPSSLAPPAQVRATVSLPPSSVLIRELTFPQNIERNLARVVELQLERELPLTREQVYVDFKIKERLTKDSAIVVALCVARKTEVDQIQKTIQGWGFRLTSISHRDASHDKSFEFLPADLRADRLSLRRVDRYLALSALTIAFLFTGVIVGRWWYERSQIAPVLREAQAAARRVEKLRTDLETQSQAALAIRQRMQQPSIATMMLKLASVTPTDSWIQRLEIKKNTDGSAMLRLTALSPAATQLLDKLRQAPEFEEVNLMSSGPAASKQPKERVEITVKWRQSASSAKEAGST